METIKSIAFAGDSFCGNMGGERDTVSYPALLRNFYQAEVTNIGCPGSSVWDLALIQFPKIFKVPSIIDLSKSKNLEVPDVLICCWTNTYRLYHPLVRDINTGALDQKDHNLYKDKELHDASKQYFKHLGFDDQLDLSYRSLLYYIDHEVFELIKDRCKIINLWSFPFRNCYRWKNGVEVRPALLHLSHWNTINRIGIYDKRDNHLEPIKNHMLFQWLRRILIDHKNGDLFDYTDLLKTEGT